MLEEKDLQLISQLLDQMEERLEKKLDEKLETKLDEKLAKQKEDLLKEATHQMQVLLDAEVTPKFNLLVDTLDIMQEKLIPSSRVEAVEGDVKVLKAAVRHLSDRVYTLEKAN